MGRKAMMTPFQDLKEGSEQHRSSGATLGRSEVQRFVRKLNCRKGDQEAI
jgi:hypothetical protein